MLNESLFKDSLETGPKIQDSTQQTLDKKVVNLYEKALVELDEPTLIQLISMQRFFRDVKKISPNKIIENFLRDFFGIGIKEEILIPIKQPDKDPDFPRAVVKIKVAEQKQDFFFPLPTPEQVKTAREHLAKNSNNFSLLLLDDPRDATFLNEAFFSKSEYHPLLRQAVTCGVSFRFQAGYIHQLINPNASRSETHLVIRIGNAEKASVLFQSGHSSPVKEDFIQNVVEKLSTIVESFKNPPDTKDEQTLEAEAKAKAEYLAGLSMKARLEGHCTKRLLPLKEKLGVFFEETQLLLKKKDVLLASQDLSFGNTTEQIVITDENLTLIIHIYKAGDEFPSKTVRVTVGNIQVIENTEPIDKNLWFPLHLSKALE